MNKCGHIIKIEFKTDVHLSIGLKLYFMIRLFRIASVFQAGLWKCCTGRPTDPPSTTNIV